MLDGYKTLATQPEVREHIIGITGTGATDPTERHGSGVAVTRTGTGAYLITWAENPGNFLGWSAHLGANTPGDLAGHTLVRDTYDTSAFTLAFVLYNDSDAAHDLAALEYIDIVVRFKQTAVSA